MPCRAAASDHAWLLAQTEVTTLSLGDPSELVASVAGGEVGDLPGCREGTDLDKFLWLLLFVSGLALRRLEPADNEEPATTDELGR